MYLSMNRNPFPKLKKPVKIKLEQVSLKEASKDKVWFSSAKPRILRSFHKHICKSNGIEVLLTQDSYFTYKYFLGQGNNSKLIKQVMSTRWWWVRVPSVDANSAHLYWTQWREQKFLDHLPSAEALKHKRSGSKPGTSQINDLFIVSPNASGLTQRRVVNVSALELDRILKSPSFTHMSLATATNACEMQMHNKIDLNLLLSNKKALFFNMKQFYAAMGENPFDYMPVTFHVTGENDKEFARFCEYQAKGVGGFLWIVKPGENTNRGNGINVLRNIDEIRKEIKNNPFPATGLHTFIIQKYIENPFLIQKRKFDIRCFALVTSINGVLQCYFYEEGYIRTSSKKFSTSDLTNMFIHLTNDAIQKKSENYGKYESGNKLTYSDLQRYLDAVPDNDKNFYTDVLPKIKGIVKDTIQATYLKIDPFKRTHTFEVFGYDFLLDTELKPWLIEVNTNPCLELSCNILARLIPAMIDNAFRIALDPLFPEPKLGPRRQSPLPTNRFELIFHSYVDGPSLINLLTAKGTLWMIQELGDLVIDANEPENEQNMDTEEGLEAILFDSE
jgi:hypothetical protein